VIEGSSARCIGKMSSADASVLTYFTQVQNQGGVVVAGAEREAPPLLIVHDRRNLEQP
jgi:hypothetical protein